MNEFLRMSARSRRLACLQAEEVKHLQAASVEKDFWVCWALHELFAHPEIGPHLTFRGGTSLSKGWDLIDRFSEDVDLIVGREALGFGGEASPDQAPGGKQRKHRLKALKEACRAWVQEELRPAFEWTIAERLGPSETWSLIVDPDAEDGQSLLLRYPGAFADTEAGYIRPIVKLELGARSDDWPSTPRVITPYLAEVIPSLGGDSSFEATTLAAERTFWEKAMILHEETFRPAGRFRKPRMARHYYDVWCLITRGVAERAAGDLGLFRRVIEHRETFFPVSWVDYSEIERGTLRLLPSAEHRAEWQRDYVEMAETMFYGARPPFEEILGVVAEFEQQFNHGAATG